MSTTRQDLIDKGVIRPHTLERVRRIKTPQEIAATFERTESVAKQLYNVFLGKAKEQDETQDEMDTQYEEQTNEFKELFRAQAKYVLSTFHENEKLRARVKELEKR